MLDWITSQFTIPSDSILIFGNYHSGLVILSVFIAIFASFMALQVNSQAQKTSSNRRQSMMRLVGSFALGGGIWSMHFIGMLAFSLCTPIRYGWILTLLSMLPGICASWVVLNFIQNQTKRLMPLLVGGVLMGAGIGTMHYAGMAAMDMAPLLRYDLWMFLLSIVVAVCLSILSLWVRSFFIKLWGKSDNQWLANLVASVVMGTAIAGMHYTGMAAARFVKPPGLELGEQTAEISYYLAFAVSSVTIVLISLVLGVNLIYRYKDISKRASESERRVRAMMETAVDGIVTIDSKGIIKSTNQAVERLLGWKEQELLGKNVSLLMPAPYKVEHDGYLGRYLETGEARIIGKGREVDALHRNGEKVSIRLAIGHVKLANDDFFVAFISDIRQRISMERALRENEEKLRSLITNIPGIAYRCVNDEAWSMIFISDAVEAITGYPAQDFLLPNPKRTFASLFHPDDKARIYQEVKDKTQFTLEYRIIRRDGEVRWVLEHGNWVTDDTSGDEWLDGFIMDITERREMELALREAKEHAEQAASARAAFLANMSHEIRTPMNAIIGFSDILLEASMGSEHQRHLKTINQSAKSLLHLLNDVLDSAKLDKGKLELETRDFSLVEEVDAVVSTLWLQAHQKGLKLRVDVSPTLKNSYVGSPERIRQVLTNLLSNAIKFTERGQVVLSVKPMADGRTIFLVEDTGIGMSVEQVEKVFDPFTQADASMSRRFGGTGLGTTISKQLVELMGGEISVESKLNIGSCFRVVLPLEQSESFKIETKTQPIDLPPMTILVVDDIQQNIELLTMLLSRNGHQVVTARDGQQALIRMESDTSIDVVLMDVQMPVLDGLSASKARRKLEHEQNIKRVPIIALTASVLEDDRSAALEAGMDGFANKPVDFSVLCAEIARVLGLEVTRQNEPTTSTTTIKVIDEQKGALLWGSVDAYYAQLNLFIKHHFDRFVALRQACERGEVDEVRRLTHTLKGVSGNLSLRSLMMSLETLENDLQHSPETCKAQIALIFDAAQKVRERVESRASETSPRSAEETSHQALLSILTNLQSVVKRHEFDEKLIETLTRSATPFTPEINVIIDRVNDFEFEDAEQKLDELVKTIKALIEDKE
ncbi:PAS domain S-box protein [Pseudoalteromonas xiamenensis]|uniref:MHYT domain-containing protein n=1 Tax=Pseudoalteromonas xiamenensis TaxID=882626 RepID=UPI0027E3D098|nr:MHYT domain-containing protein [Pseudoalteromonas xiamenensis]WMN60661.1 PAS domain S-box protein [Pseudoalteromonas xiamenensis]